MAILRRARKNGGDGVGQHERNDGQTLDEQGHGYREHDRRDPESRVAARRMARIMDFLRRLRSIMHLAAPISG